MFFERPITEIIDERHAVRTYEERLLPKETIVAIQHYIQEVLSPYEGKVRIEFLQNVNEKEKVKLGTYGVIKGGKYYLTAACKKGENPITLGYALEKIVLYCTSLGLGTVWMGGTYNKSQFAKAMKLQEDEELLIIVPVGYESDKKSFVAKLMGNHNKQRKEFETIFFDKTVGTPLTRNAAGRYETALEMVRLAPSAMNQQPWRAVKQGERFDFYVVNTKGLKRIDLGIALAHFYMTLSEQGISGAFRKEQPMQDSSMAYVVSWIAN